MTAKTGKSVLQEAEELVNGDRHVSYGHCLDNFSRIAAHFNAQFSHKIKQDFTAEDMEMVQVLVKISRQAHLPARDNIVDACGYLGLIEKTDAERRRREGRAASD